MMLCIWGGEWATPSFEVTGVVWTGIISASSVNKQFWQLYLLISVSLPRDLPVGHDLH